MLTLYDYYRSSASFRVRIALNLKGLQYKTIPIHLINQGGEQHSDAYHKINPHHLVPVLQDENKQLTQSLAIIEYLNECHPAPPLLPADAYERALVRAFALSIAADIHPINNLRVMNYLSHDLHITAAQKSGWIKHWVNRGLLALETQLTTFNCARTYCFGDQPTLADICLVPQLFNARRFECDLHLYPTLVRIDQTCQAHPAFSKAWSVETVT